MTPPNASSIHQPAKTALISLEQDPRWGNANDEEKAVLRRIALQRDRLAARKAAHQQAVSLQAPSSVSPDAPLAQRLMTFVQLHPVASVALCGAVLFLGPRKIMRVGITVLPLLAKLRKSALLPT